MFSFKPPSGAGVDLDEKVARHASIPAAAAWELDPKSQSASVGCFEVVPSDLPLGYADTNKTRAGLIRYGNILRGHTVVMVGLGGTGSYSPDQVAKT